MTLASSYGRVSYKFGQNPEIGIGTAADIWGAGGVKTDLTVESKLSLVSDEITDTPAGVGAWSILIQGICADLCEHSEVVILDGTDAVQTVNSYLMLHEAYVYQGGSSSQVGTITITAVTGGSVQGVISPTTRSITSTHYMIPKDYGMSIINLWASIEKLSGGAVTLLIKNPGENTVYRSAGSVIMFQNIATFNYAKNVVIPTGTRIKLSMTAGSNKLAVSGGWNASLIPQAAL